MSWRSLQLKQKACVQDQIILDLYKDQKVNFIGKDQEFAQWLNLDDNADNLIFIVQKPYWISELVDETTKLLSDQYQTFYIGINRYYCLGNDTDIEFNYDSTGQQLITLLSKVVNKLGYSVDQSGYFDNDHGRYMNFAQPLTWLHGIRTQTTDL